jgi:hypothetical protein
VKCAGDGPYRMKVMNESPYDSTLDTQAHISSVARNLNEVTFNLSQRALVHDLSKLEEPEKSAFDQATPKLKDMVYGSDEYRAALREIKPALEHHYALNDHHPEHYPIDGVLSMSLMAIIEMLADWKAAGERHDPPIGINRSIAYNATRFEIPPYLTQIFYNTARELGWE